MRPISSRQRPPWSRLLMKRWEQTEQRKARSWNQRSQVFLRERFERAEPHLGHDRVIFLGGWWFLARVRRMMAGEHPGLLAVEAVAFYGVLIELLDQLAVKILLCKGVGDRGIDGHGFRGYLGFATTLQGVWRKDGPALGITGPVHCVHSHPEETGYHRARYWSLQSIRQRYSMGVEEVELL